MLKFCVLFAAFTIGYSMAASAPRVVCKAGGCVVVGEIDLSSKSIISGDVIEDEKEVLSKSVTDKQRIWPNGVVPYIFQETFMLQERKRIEEAMRGIEASTCIKFVPMKDVKDAQKTGFVQIVHGKNGCHANLGYWPTRGVSVVVYNPLICLKKLGTIQHELLHLLGLKHEHARPDRDDYIEVVEKNIEKDHINNFVKADKTQFSTYGVEYDYESVMHYGSKAFSKNDKETIKPKKPNVDVDKMGQRNKISGKDIEKLNKLYNCPRK